MPVQFAFVQVGVEYNGRSNIPVPIAATVTSEMITPSASNQQTTATAPSGLGEVMCRVATDLPVYVAFGTNPNATTTGTRFFMPANAIEYFRVNVGSKAAVVNA